MAEDEEARAKAKAAVQHVLDLFHAISKKQNYNGFDRRFMEEVRLVDADPAGGVTWELKITDDYANQNGVMHGGAAGVIFDMGTTTALCPIARPGYWDFLGGVTRSLNISYLKAIPAGSIIRIKAKTIQHGRTMALIRGTMESVDGKTIYATVEHHKVHVPTREGHYAMEMEMKAAKEKQEKAKL